MIFYLCNFQKGNLMLHYIRNDVSNYFLNTQFLSYINLNLTIEISICKNKGMSYCFCLIIFYFLPMVLPNDKNKYFISCNFCTHLYDHVYNNMSIDVNID